MENSRDVWILDALYSNRKLIVWLPKGFGKAKEVLQIY